ncbi:Acetyl-CoA biotin carboxyl carrier [Phycisphaerae bacterium RAS2]|nr:Acetyl-CoA biotin carboxyl carrier [Phycisphaerae bacterium RAS2]
MDIDEIKTLTDLMVENDLSEIMIRDGEKRIVLRRGGRVPVVAAVQAAIPAAHAAAAHAPAPTAAAPAPAASAAPAVDASLAAIKSPMVGTFYATPDPDAPAFVKVGDRVSPETVVCIIEAMKVFNEIKAEVSGTIESIDVTSGTPVEFGQVLMRVRP